MVISREGGNELLERLPSFRAYKLGVPFIGFLEITAKCNFRCVHCFLHPRSLKRTRKPEMTTAEVISVLHQLADIGVLRLSIGGGEPLIRPDFWKIINLAKKREFAIVLYTNGSLITKDGARRLADLFLKNVYMSLYGMNERVYRSVTGAAGAFKKTMQGLEALIKEGVNVDLRIIILRENFHQLKMFEKFVKKINIEHSFQWSFHPCLDRCRSPLTHMINEAQLEKLVHLHPEECKPAIDSIPDASHLLCDFVLNTVAINAYGEVRQCPITENRTNIRERPIVEIFRKDAFFKRLRKIYWRHIPQCLNCEALLFCKPCPADFFVYTGKLVASAPKKMCEVAWMRKRAYEKLKR